MRVKKEREIIVIFILILLIGTDGMAKSVVDYETIEASQDATVNKE